MAGPGPGPGGPQRYGVPEPVTVELFGATAIALLAQAGGPVAAAPGAAGGPSTTGRPVLQVEVVGLGPAVANFLTALLAGIRAPGRPPPLPGMAAAPPVEPAAPQPPRPAAPFAGLRGPAQVAGALGVPGAGGLGMLSSAASPAGIAAAVITAVQQVMNEIASVVRNVGQQQAATARFDPVGVQRAQNELIGKIPILGGLLQSLADSTLNLREALS